jgi:WD40 repeat protein
MEVTMILRIVSLFLLVGCAVEAPLDEVRWEAPPRASTGLAVCAEEGRALDVLYAVGNGHGAILAMALRGQEVALAAEDGSVKTWSLRTREQLAALDRGAGAAIYGSETEISAPFVALDFEAAGGMVVGGNDQGGVSLYGLDDDQLLDNAAPLSEAIRAVAFSADGTSVALASSAFGGELSVWSLNESSTTPVAPNELLWGVWDVEYGADGALVAAGNWYGVPAIERRVLGQAPHGAKLGGFSSVYPTDITAMAVLANGDMVVGGRSVLEGSAGQGFVAVLSPSELNDDWVTELPRSTELEGHGVVALAATRDLFATVGEDGSLRVFAADASQLLDMPGAGAAHVAFTSDGEQIVTAGADGDFRVWGCAAE